MLPGYNHNVRYGDGVYHVQTEDSGVQNPHIITHLFIGGNIIATRRVSYSNLLSEASLGEQVVDLMQNQHKTMLRDLIKGRFDDKIQTRSKNAATLNGPAPLNVEAGQNTASFGVGARNDAPPPPATAAGPHDVAAPPPPTPAPASAPKAVERPAPATAKPFKPLPSTTAPPPAAQPFAPPAAPPASIFASDEPGGEEGETVIEAATLEKAFDSTDESAVDSIFGEDLISEKSLDEVILSYLAEDMQKE